MSPLRILAWLAPIVALALIALTYGRRDPQKAAPPTGRPAVVVPEGDDGFPRDVDMQEGGSVHLEHRPRRVLVANASLLDTVIAVWPPKRLVAVPVQAMTWSAAARRPKEFAELPRFERFVAEDMLRLAPDLVICSQQSSPETIAALQSANVPVLRMSNAESFDDARRDLARIAEALGVDDKTAQDSLQARSEAIAHDVGERSGLSALFFVHDGSEGWSSGARTPADEILRLAGFNNAAARAGLIGTSRVSFEELLEMDPEVIVVPAAVGEEDGNTLTLLRQESALRGLSAVKEGHIVTLHPSLFSTSSIEIVTAAEELARAADEMLARTRKGHR
ncbi:MAG: ABC transporter substrate-binding protein [Planctomycetota bacterium]